MIPYQLRREGIRFVLLEKSGKKPFQQAWQTKNIAFNDAELLNHLIQGGNYGIMGGGAANLLIVDFDSKKVQDELVNKLPETLTIKTGSGMLHKYFFSDRGESFKIFDEDMNTLVDVQGEGKQAVGPGSTHPNGNKYEILEDKEIATVSYSELQALILPFDKKPKKVQKKEMEYPVEYKHDDFIEVVKRKVPIEKVLEKYGVNTARNPTSCPFHASKGGKCLSFSGEVAHCFHCDGSWNIFSFVMESNKCGFRQALEIIANDFGLADELQESRKKYVQSLTSAEELEYASIRSDFLDLATGKDAKINEATEVLVDAIKKKYHIYTTKDDLKSEMWIYKEGIYVPQGKSELREFLRKVLKEWFTNFYFNLVIAKIEPDTYIDTDKFFEIRYPNEVAVQNGVLNIFTGQLGEFTPQKIFFHKFPVIFDPSVQCTNIDKFLSDVLANEEDKKAFYEFVGFGLLKEYRYEKAAMAVGDGRNGKGKTLELVKLLYGPEACTSVPLRALHSESFSVSELYSKHFNLAGDIDNTDLKDTGTFKSLTGRDLITVKRKFLRDLSFYNFAKFFFACNELPTVYDTSRGFWDRWILFEFPYTFVNQKEYDEAVDKTKLKIKDENIISKIATAEELSGFLNQALLGLKRLIENHDFSQTRGTQQIKDLWIRRANSFTAFAFDFLEEDYDNFITKRELRKRYSEYCKKHGVPNKSDFVLKKVLQEMYGAGEERIVVNSFPDNKQEFVWRGIKWKSSVNSQKS